MTIEILKIEDLSYKYEQEPVLEDINFVVKKGDFLGLLGVNGSGKSTLLKLILNLLKLQHGQIFLYGEKIKDFRNWENIGYVSQKANSFNSGFPATVKEIVESGLVKKTGMFRFFTLKHQEKCLSAIEQVGMQNYLHRNIGELSGGQQQRVFIARALVSSPELLILDEPTVGVDEKNVHEFYQLLKKLNQNAGLTIILVSHDTDLIMENATKIISLNNKVIFNGSPDAFAEFRSKQLHDIYGNGIKEFV